MRLIIRTTIFLCLLLASLNFLNANSDHKKENIICLNTFNNSTQERVHIKKKQKELNVFVSNDYLILQKRGCCSWHNGVCGCNYGRAVCCDGTLSPSCGCD